MQTEATLAQSDVSELDLVKRCQAGDTEAFDELVTRYRTRVFGMIYNMVHSEQDAWDLAQESFLKAWRSIGRFRGQSSFYTWIYRIVMNVTIDWLRKKRVKGGGAEFDDAIQLREIEPASKTVPKTEALPPEAMERDEIRVRIEKAIGQLSPEHRAVILMKEIDEMQYHEIAEAKNLGELLKRELTARPLTNEEFFSHHLRERIVQESGEQPRKRARGSSTSSWWTIPRLLWAGTASLAVFLICTVLVMRQERPAEESQYLTQILNARVDPVVSPNATVSIFEVKQDRATVLWTEGLQSLPADYAAK